jgi:hypothetical protein
MKKLRAILNKVASAVKACACRRFAAAAGRSARFTIPRTGRSRAWGPMMSVANPELRRSKLVRSHPSGMTAMGESCRSRRTGPRIFASTVSVNPVKLQNQIRPQVFARR